MLRLNRAWVDAGRGKPRPYTKFWNNLDTGWRGAKQSWLRVSDLWRLAHLRDNPPGTRSTLLPFRERIRHHFLFQPGKPVIVAIGSAAGQFGQKTEGKTG